MPSVKPVAGYLYNLVQRFDTSCEHIRYLLQRSEALVFTANLLTGEIAPASLAIARNQNVVALAQKVLALHIQPLLAEPLLRAELCLTFTGQASVTAVILQTASGRVWRQHSVVPDPLICP